MIQWINGRVAHTLVCMYAPAGVADINSDVGATREPPVIPAKAGIQSVDSVFPKVCRVDSRFRGNDRRLEWIPIPNDTGTWN
jgi:hypothetical protein